MNSREILLSSQSFVILPLGESEALSLCSAALRALEQDAESFCRHYCRLCSYLLTQSDLTQDFLRAITGGSNAFARESHRKSMAQMSPALIQAVEHDLAVLGHIASLTADELIEQACFRFAEAEDVLRALPRFPTGEPFPLCSAQQLYEYYRQNGFGFFWNGISFTLSQGKPCLVTNPDTTRLQDLRGYERQKQQILDNTEAFLQYMPANNILLYGDKGTGKSSTIKAVVNEYAHRGLKIIEMRCDQLLDYPAVCRAIGESPYHFILFLDDLSFPQEDANYGMLKTIMEGGVARQPDNLLIYATSNRRHIIRESFAERQGDEIHRRDAIASTTSLSDRFGLEITFSTPDRDEYLDIVDFLAQQANLAMDTELLHLLAERFALRRGGRSPRTAQQFIRQQCAQAQTSQA